MPEPTPNAELRRFIPLSRAAASLSMSSRDLKRELLDSRTSGGASCLHRIGRFWRVDVEAFTRWVAARQVIALDHSAPLDRASIRLEPRLVRRRAGASRG